MTDDEVRNTLTGVEIYVLLKNLRETAIHLTSPADRNAVWEMSEALELSLDMEDWISKELVLPTEEQSM